MIQVQLEEQTEASLHQLAAELQVSADFLAQQAIETLIEDRADYLTGIRSLANTQYVLSQQEMERRSELAD